MPGDVVAPAAPGTGRAAGPSGKKKSSGRWIRENLESFAVAIVLAVILKYFALEAYQIPTSSMQPTLMGSRAAGVNDRILVDKLTHLFRDPQRWDITVFNYPINISQNYVKRLVGIGPETLKVADGNLYRLEPGSGDKPPTFVALRKPDRIQEGLWKLVYDTSYAELGGAPVRPDQDFSVDCPGGRTSWVDRALVCELPDKGQLRGGFNNVASGNMTGSGVDRLRDHYWHGYPVSIQEIVQNVKSGDMRGEPGGAFPVQDLRATLQLRVGAGIQSFHLSVRMQQEAGGPRVFKLELDQSGGRLVAEMERQPATPKRTFATGLKPGVDMRVSFAHVDDQVIIKIDGSEAARFEYTPAATGLKPGERVELSFGAEGTGELRIGSFRIERDIHYTQNGIAENGRSFDVPAGHYFMMGDNTQASEDGRAWTALEFKLGEQGEVMAPDDPKPGRMIRGNRRSIPTTAPVDADENPVIVRRTKQVVFTDWLGEEHVFPWNGQEWNPHAPAGVVERPVSFVPKDNVIGRALLVFWPLWPPALCRFGFVR